MAAPFSPETRSTIHLSPQRSAGEGAPLPFSPVAARAAGAKLHRRAPFDSALSSPFQVGADELEALKGRNQWLQYAVAGFAAWSVAATYAAITYQGGERADLHSQIKNLKASLYDLQGRSADILEVAYRPASSEGSRSFAEISELLALDEVSPEIAPAADTRAKAEPNALLAPPETIAAKATQTKTAATVPAEPAALAAAEDLEASRLSMPAISRVFGVPPQYSVLGDLPRGQEPFAAAAAFAGPAVLAERLPITPLAAKLAPVSVAALTLSGRSPKTMNLRRVRRPLKPRPTLLAGAPKVGQKPLNRQSGSVAITAYPGRQAKRAGELPAFAPAKAKNPQGDVAKLYLP